MDVNLPLAMFGFKDNFNKERLERFDSTYENSTFIKSMKVKSDGEFYHYTKVLSDDVLEMLVEYIDKIIEENITNILGCDFNINPKYDLFTRWRRTILMQFLTRLRESAIDCHIRLLSSF